MPFVFMKYNTTQMCEKKYHSDLQPGWIRAIIPQIVQTGNFQQPRLKGNLQLDYAFMSCNKSFTLQVAP